MSVDDELGSRNIQIKRNKKSPGRVTWGVEDANKRKLPGHVCEQEHHR